MAFVQDNHVVQAFTPDTPDQPLDVRILPRTSGGDYDFLDPHMPHPLPKGGAIGAVPIAQQIWRCFIPWEGVNDLLGGPLRGGVFRDIEMDETSSLMGQDEQDVQHLVGDRRHDEEI